MPTVLPNTAGGGRRRRGRPPRVPDGSLKSLRPGSRLLNLFPELVLCLLEVAPRFSARPPSAATAPIMSPAGLPAAPGPPTTSRSGLLGSYLSTNFYTRPSLSCRPPESLRTRPQYGHRAAASAAAAPCNHAATLRRLGHVLASRGTAGSPFSRPVRSGTSLARAPGQAARGCAPRAQPAGL
jgi:hypothetical protein